MLGLLSSPHLCVQTGSEAHPASYSMGTRGFYHSPPSSKGKDKVVLVLN
jgi:hypothetical protein